MNIHDLTKKWETIRKTYTPMKNDKNNPTKYLFLITSLKQLTNLLEQSIEPQFTFKCLNYCGDLARYIHSSNPTLNNSKLAIKYYHDAIMLDPSIGLPFNALALIYISIDLLVPAFEASALWYSCLI